MSLSIADYALIGDCETAALVGCDGSIDWLCWPRFDSGACFSALLGTPQHGRWRIAPAASEICSRRQYRGDTLILDTRFETGDGAVSVIDFMPIREDRNVSDLVRIVVGLRGRVPMRMDLALRFDYGRIVPWVTRIGDDCLRAVAGQHSVMLKSLISSHYEDMTVVAEFDVTEGERVPFLLNYQASHLPAPCPCSPEEALEETEAFWTEWSGRCNYKGEWAGQVKRSLITVKALTYRPSGGIVAAPTTSLPERIGGERNWDYRYCWIRDATFTLMSLINAGYREEAESWCDWLVRAVAGAASQIQPLYGICGEHRLDEIEVTGLPGYKDSRPVRIGNAAYSQLQIDIFGSVMDTLHEARCFGLTLQESSSGLQRQLLTHLEQVWQEPDEGIWEVRSGRRHFVHAKLMSWVAFDRAVASAEQFGFEGPVDHWRSLRDRIRAEILERGFSKERGAFVQSYGSNNLDAAILLMPIVGFLPADDPRIVSTVEAIERDLSRDGFLLRYDTDASKDGLSPGEGAFLACSFWLVDNLILQGRHEDARKLYEKLLALCNDVGLLAEQWDPHNRVFTGNFPQAFSHFALVDTAFNFAGIKGSARESEQR